MRAPKKLYWLEITRSNKLPYNKKGGGKYTDRDAAVIQKDWMKTRYGVDSVLYETQPLEWTEVKEEAK